MQKKTGIILMIILFICIVIALSGILLCQKNNKKSEHDLYMDKAKELVRNNNTLSYLLYGNVQTDDSYILEDSERYYSVNDKNIKNIKTIDDIIALIEKTIKSNFRSTFINYLTSNTANNYLEANGKLYVKIMDISCKDMTIDNENDLKYHLEEDKMIIEEENTIQAIKEGDDYYLTGLAIGCTTEGFTLENNSNE